MLNNNITNVLKQMTNITNSAILKYPRTILNSTAGDVIVSIDMQNLDKDEFSDIGIYDLNGFLNTFNLFGENRSVTLSDKLIMISETDNVTKEKTNVEYITNSISLLKEYDKSPNIFSTTENVPTVAEFTLTPAHINKIKNPSKIFTDLEDISIVSKDGGIIMSLSSSNKFNAQSNKFSTTINATTTKEFSIAISGENFNNLPLSTYKVNIKYNATKNAYRILLISTEAPVKILMNIKK